MVRSLNLACVDDALVAVREFHWLRDKRERDGDLTLEEERLCGLLRDVFEPKLATRSGVLRRPIKLQVHRCAILRGPGSDRQEVELVGVSLREVDVVMRCLLPIGDHVRLLVASGREWLRLGGRVLDLDPAASLATLAVHSATALRREVTKSFAR